jgi:hypothetical protein
LPGPCSLILLTSIADDPQALAGDAYQLCFGKNLAGYEKDITIKVEAARKELRQGLINIQHKAAKSGDKCYIYEAMVDIYDKALLERAGKGNLLHFTTQSSDH